VVGAGPPVRSLWLFSTRMIEAATPSDWRDLQLRVARILQEAGFEATVEQEVPLVRGSVDVDVAAWDRTTQPPLLYLCECKHWHKKVPKAAVHQFRTVMADAGAHVGFLISSSGFQAGSVEAAGRSNISLVTWPQFQETFEERWIERYMIPRLREHTGPLIDYTEPLNSRVSGKTDLLSDVARAELSRLRQEFGLLPLLLAPIHSPHVFAPRAKLRLPLNESITEEGARNVPAELLEISAYRDLLGAYVERVDAAVAEFDAVFGSRV
jgi:restriction system protein